MIIQLKLFLTPVPKGRPRFSRKGFAYTPHGTRVFELEAKRHAKVQYKGKPLLGALSIEIDIVCKRPKKPTNPYPTGDVDNYCKAVLDAMNGILFLDDTQICEIVARKIYANQNQQPYIYLSLREFTAGDAQCD